MKLSKTVNKKPKAFTVDGGTFYVHRFTVAEVKKLHEDVKDIQDKSKELLKLVESGEALTPEQEAEVEQINGALVMFLFRNVVVGDDGKPFEEVTEDLTYDGMCELLPVQTLQKLPTAVMDAISGNEGKN